MRKDDYFTIADMQRHGPDVWARVRAKLRTEGHNVVDGYGMYGHAIDGRHYVFLSSNGNLVHTKEKPKGLQIDIAKYLGLGKFAALKIRTGNDVDVVIQAFEHLVGLGYSDQSRRAVTSKGKMVGLLADTDGVIYSILTGDSFDNKYNHAEELTFDKAVEVTLTNFRPLRKRITVGGFEVYEDDFNEFIESHAIKSAT